ncbi:hypothetical protein YC2023_067108 [Brassica napus]
MLFTNQVIFSSREFRPPEKLEMANLLSDEPTANSIMTKVIIHVLNVQESIGLDGFQKDSKTSLFGPNGETDKILAKGKDGFRPDLKGTCLGPYQEYILHLSKSWSFMMFGLQRKSNKEKPQRNSNSQTPFKYPLNYFDEFVSVQEQPAIRRKTTRDVADPRRRLLQFDVQQFCDNFVKGVDKALKDVSKSQKKSTSTRAPVAEPSLFISKKAQGESENHFEELKDFSDSLSIFDESDEELIESLMFCEKDCDLPSLETEFNLDNEQAIVGLTVLQSEHPSSLVLSQQDFEEEPLDIPHQCPCLDIWTSLDEVPEPIFDEVDEPDPVFDEEATSIISTFMESHLCFDSGTTTASSSPSPLLHDLQEHCEEPSSLNSLPDMVVKVSFHLLGRPFDLDLQQTDFCAEKSLDLFVCKGNGFDLSSSRHPDLLSFETDKTWYFLRSFRDNDVGKDMHILKMNTVVAYLDKILVCNIYFDEHLDRLKNERQVQPLNESIGRAQQPQIWRSFVVQTGYLGASDRGSVQEGYLNIPKVFCLESNFTRKPTHQGFTEAWIRMKSFTDEEVVNFPNWRFFSLSIREYQISKGDSCPRKNRPEPKPILHEPKVFPRSFYCLNQKHLIFSSREFRPPEKLEMANLLSDEPTANSIMTKVIIHVLNVQESIGLDGFQKDSKTSLFGPNGETDKILAKGKDGFRPDLKGTCLGPYQEYILHLSKSWSFMMFGLQRKSNKEKPQRNSNSQTPFKYPLNYFDEFVSVQEQPAIRRKTTRDVADPRRRLLQFDVQQFCDNFVKGVDKALKDVSKSQKKSTSTRAPVAEPSLFISKKAQGESENHFEELKDFSDSLSIFDESDEELIESLMFCEKDCDLPSLETEFNLDNEQAIVGLTVLQSEHPSSLVLSQQDFEEEPLDIPHQCPCLDIWTSLDEVPEPIFDEVDEPDPVFDEEATSIISTFMESHLCFDSGTTTASSSPSPLLHDLQEHCEEPSSLNSLPDMVVKVRNVFDLSSSRHVLITDELFASSYALDEILIQKLPDLLSFETDKTWYFLRSFRDNDVGKDMHILKMNTVVAYLDKILVCNIYFDEHLDRLKNERQVQPLNESIGRAQQPQIWRSFVVQTGYLGASDRGSVQEGYLNIPKVFCLESNFTRKPTHQGFTEAWNRMKSFTDEEVVNFPNWRFFSLSIREYQISKGDSCPRKNRPEPKPILHEPKVFPRSFYCLNQKHLIFSSREFRPPEKLEMANLLSDEPTANSIMTKVIIHVLNVQESIGLDGFQKDSKTSLFGPNGETDKILAKGKDGFRPDLKGTCLGPYQEYILHLSKSWSWLYEEVVQVSVKDFL